MDPARATTHVLQEITNVIDSSRNEAIYCFRVPVRQAAADVEYKHLRTIRLRGCCRRITEECSTALRIA